MIPGIIESARYVSSFADTFDRANSADLATTQFEWQEVIGDWQINSNTAFSPTAVSSYPLAVFESLRENGTFRSYQFSNTVGYGVAFWVTDANNWWAAVTESTSSSTTTSAYTCPSGGSLSGTTCLRTCTDTVNTYSCPDGGTLSGTTCIKTCTSPGSFSGYTGGTCPANQSVSPDSNCICNDPGGCACSGNPVDVGSCTCYVNGIGPEQYPGQCAQNGYVSFGGVCYASSYSGAVAPYSYGGSGCTPVYSGGGSYDCSYGATLSGSTTTTYNCDYAATLSTVTITTFVHTIRLLKREAGVVSQIASTTFYTGNSDFSPNQLTVVTNLNNITVTGTNGGSSVSIAHSAVNPIRNTRHGLILAPASRSQASRIDRFDYTI